MFVNKIDLCLGKEKKIHGVKLKYDFAYVLLIFSFVCIKSMTHLDSYGHTKYILASFPCLHTIYLKVEKKMFGLKSYIFNIFKENS